jgi:hypothetical protein
MGRMGLRPVACRLQRRATAAYLFGGVDCPDGSDSDNDFRIRADEEGREEGGEMTEGERGLLARRLIDRGLITDVGEWVCTRAEAAYLTEREREGLRDLILEEAEDGTYRSKVISKLAPGASKLDRLKSRTLSLWHSARLFLLKKGAK